MSVYRQHLWGAGNESSQLCNGVIQLLCFPRDRFGRAKKKTVTSLYIAAYWHWSTPLLILLFLSQELPAASSAPVYRHYSHGATLIHN